jgi:hypothetical protein
MSGLQIGLALAVLLLLVGWWLVRREPSAGTAKQDDRLDTVTGWPPTSTRVLGAHERLIFNALVRALPDHIVLAQVPLSRFITVPKRNSYADWLRRVGYQCVDFVVCDNAAQTIAVIELENAQPSDRARKRMRRIARTLNAAKVRLLIWDDFSAPTAEVVREAVLPQAPPAREPLSRPMPLSPPEIAPLPPVSVASRVAPALSANLQNPFQDTSQEEGEEAMIDLLAPPSTWYDDMDSDPVPLGKR